MNKFFFTYRDGLSQDNEMKHIDSPSPSVTYQNLIKLLKKLNDRGDTKRLPDQVGEWGGWRMEDGGKR